jgi:hypothetical protein
VGVRKGKEGINALENRKKGGTLMLKNRKNGGSLGQCPRK